MTNTMTFAMKREACTWYLPSLLVPSKSLCSRCEPCTNPCFTARLKFINLCLPFIILERTKRTNTFSWNLIYLGEKRLFPSNWTNACCCVLVLKSQYYERYRKQCNMRLILMNIDFSINESVCV